MSCMMALAKRRAAMVVGDFDYTNNGQPLTALPAILTALNATYTRNSVKNVVQNGAMVSLAANQFGTSYDPVAGLYGYVTEPAATNLATNSDGNAATYTLATNVADGTAVTGFTNGIAFGNNSVDRSAFKTVSMTSGTTYSVSVFVIMDDGGAPVVGTANNAGDFCLLSEVQIHSSAALVRYIGNGVYRVSSSRACVSTAAWYCGVKKYTGQSARTFRITGIQVETGLRATSYIATTGSTASRSADVLTVPLWVNNVKDSQDGSTANWTRTNCTVTTSGTAPDGSATAQLLTASSTTSITAYNNSCKAPSTTVTASIYVKAGNKPTVIVGLRNNTTSTAFQTGTLTFATGVITGAGWTATDVGSGWFRCTFTQSSGISVGDTLYIYPFYTQALTSGDTAYFWGAQIEPGSVATTYRHTVNNLEYSRNLASFSDGAATTYTVSNVTDGTAVPGFTNGLAFGNNSVDRTAFKTITLTLGATYTVSVFVIMDDGGAPVAGASYVAGDFRLTVDGHGTGAGTAVHVGNNVYRVSASFTALTGGARNCGLGKYTGQSARTFRVTGIQVENGSTMTTYEPTNTVTPSANANIKGFSSAGYTLAVDARSDTLVVSQNRHILGISDLSTSIDNYASISNLGTTDTTIRMVSKYATVAQSLVTFAGSTDRFKAAFKVEQNAILAAASGTALTPDSSCTNPANLVVVSIGALQGLTWNGFIFNAKLITIPVTQAQLNGLTT